MSGVANIPRWAVITIVIAFNVIMMAAVPLGLSAADSRFNDCFARLAARPDVPDHLTDHMVETGGWSAGPRTPAEVRFSECQSDQESDSVRAYLALPIAVLVDLVLVAVLMIRRSLALHQNDIFRS
jgi:hypothetical protein